MRTMTIQLIEKLILWNSNRSFTNFRNQALILSEYKREYFYNFHIWETFKHRDLKFWNNVKTYILIHFSTQIKFKFNYNG